MLDASRSDKQYQRIPFLFVSSLTILILLHGVSAFKILAILYVNYRIPQSAKTSRFTPYLIWTFNISVLFCNEIFQGYKFGHVLPVLGLLVSCLCVYKIPKLRRDFRMKAYGLDSYRAGILPLISRCYDSYLSEWIGIGHNLIKVIRWAWIILFVPATKACHFTFPLHSAHIHRCCI